MLIDNVIRDKQIQVTKERIKRISLWLPNHVQAGLGQMEILQTDLMTEMTAEIVEATTVVPNVPTDLLEIQEAEEGDLPADLEGCSLEMNVTHSTQA